MTMHLGLRSLAIALLAVSAVARAQSDSCASATTIGTGTFFGSTTSASNDGSSSCGETTTSADVWYRFVSPDAGDLHVTSCGSGYDTVLSLHSSCPGDAGNELDCNDDAPAVCGGGSISSAVIAHTSSGATTYIRVAGWQGATGSFTLNVAFAQPQGNDACSNAIPIGDGTFFGETASASNDGTSSCGETTTSNDVWYAYTATDACRLRVSTCGSNFDTVLSIHTGCPGTDQNELRCNDDANGACGTGSSVSLDTTIGATYLIRIAGWQGATGSFTLNTRCDTPPPPGADILIGNISQIVQFGRVGDVIGCGMDSPCCNQGDQPLDWYGNPDPRHPFMNSGVYRIEGGRFEQIGTSWSKHGFGAGQDDACGLGCSPFMDETHLGVGCSDTYDAGTNAFQGLLGPRAEINPWTGAYTFAGSYLDLHGGDSHDAVEHRLRLHDADIDPAGHPSATFVGECTIVAHDDVNHLDSVAWVPVTPSGGPGGDWSFGLGGSTLGAAIGAWPGATLTTLQDAGATDGRAFLGVVVTDNGNGTWHYEYVIENLDMDRAVASFRIPVGGQTHVTNVGFHSVETDDGYSNAAWTFGSDGVSIQWSTTPFSTNPLANALRWGNADSFRFDADAPPADTTVTLGLWKPGSPSSLAGVTTGPRVGPCRAGTVGAGAGPVADVLFVNGSAGDSQTRVVTVARGEAIDLSLAAAPGGPATPRYGIWIWGGNSTHDTNLVARGQTLGCTVNPTPLVPNPVPRPVRCLRGGLPTIVCRNVSEIAGAPARGPWTVHRASGFASHAAFVFQGVVEDAGSANSTGYSVTNAVLLDVP